MIRRFFVVLLLLVVCCVAGCHRRRAAANNAGYIQGAQNTVTGQSIFAAAISDAQARAAILRALTDQGFVPTMDAEAHIEGMWTQREQQIAARIEYSNTGCSSTLTFAIPQSSRLVDDRLNGLLSAITVRIEEESRRGIVVMPGSVNATVVVTPPR